MFIRITDHIAVAPQISAGAVADAAAQGFRIIVNNRPDDESPGQPAGAEIAAACQAAGVAYIAIPIDHSGFNLEQVTAMAAAMHSAAEMGGRLLAYCRSGTRSCNLWALAAAHGGDDPAAIIAAAGQGGYDVAALLPLFRQLAGGRA